MGYEGLQLNNSPKVEKNEDIKNKLEAQFEKPEEIEVYGGKMKVIDLKPEQLKTLTPTILLRGWGTTTESYKGNTIGLAEKNRRVLAIDAPYGIDEKSVEGLSELETNRIPEVELRKVAATLKTIYEKNFDKVDIVAHSEGAIYGAYAAMLHPDKIRNFILVDPAGLIGEDNPGRLVVGAIFDFVIQTGKIWKRIFSEKGLAALKNSTIASSELLKVFAKNPLHEVESIGAISHSRIEEMIETLHDLGIHVTIVHGVDDKFFNIEQMQKMISAKIIDGFYSVEGTHNQMLVSPEDNNIVVDHALDSMEKISELEDKTEK